MIRFRGFSTFRARIFWTVIPFLIALLLFHGVMDLREHRRLVTEQFMKRGQAMAGNLAYSGELGVFAEDRQLLESSMRGVIGDPDVAYVVIYGEGGKILAQAGRQVGELEPAGRTWALSAEEARVVRDRGLFSQSVAEGRGRFVEFLAPILSEEAKTPEETMLGPQGKSPGAGPQRQRVIGVVRLGLSLRSIEEHVLALVRLWGGVTLVFFGLSTVAVYAFSRRITRPIKQLTGHAEKIAHGVLDQVIPVDSRDEIGRLATTFNEMAGALKGNIEEKERILEELQNLNRTLEDRIQQRTAELQERTRALQQTLEEVQTLGEVSQAVSSSLDLAEVLETVAAHAVRLSSSDACGIFEIDPARNRFVVVATHSLSPRFVEALQGPSADPKRSAVSRASEGGEPVQFPDLAVPSDFAFRDIVLKEGFRALLAVPMGGGDVVRGIVLYRKEPGGFEGRIVNLLTTLANQSKVAIDNARLFREIQNQRIQLEHLSMNMEQLYRLSTALQEPLSLKEQLTRVLEAARRVVQIDRFCIWVVTPTGGGFAALAGAGFSEEAGKEVPAVEIPMIEAGAIGQAYRDGRSLVFNEQNPLPPELRLRAPYSEQKALRSKRFLVVPMIARGRRVGVLAADNMGSGAPISFHTVELLQIFASHAAVAIENGRLFQEIEEKGRQLEIASKHKSQFLANMSHELRTPLNAVLGYIELVLDNIFGEFPEEIRDVLQRARHNGLHLLGLINDVLDLSRIEAGQLNLSLGDYSMGEVVHTVLTAVESLASEKKLTLKAVLASDLPPGKGDERRIVQVLLNLVGNAIKFTEAGDVTVEAAVSDGTFLVSVSDTGPGISAADQARIFEEFQQADSSSTRKKGGTGLGLSIAKRIVQLHGGRIWVESGPGKGSTFRFTVPVLVERESEKR
jgi:signal transduction histidine kinase